MLEPPLSTKVPFVRFDTADSTIPGNNQRVSNSVFKVTRIIDIVDELDENQMKTSKAMRASQD